jgi:hypothetical protein
MARSYINRFGRFSSPDPLAGSLSNPQSLNRYAYVESDPINLADPSGAFLGPAIGSVPLYGPILNQNGGGAFGGATQDDINSEGQIFGDHARLAGDLVNDAFNKALKMLQSDKCNMFIGGNSVVSASQTLQELMSGNPDYGTVQVADLGQPLSYGTSLNAQTTGTPMSVQTNDLSIDGSTLTSEITTATITMNSASIGIARNPAVDLTTQNALTMLHELGHAINFIQGEGTSFVATDNMGTAQGLAQSQVNADLVAAMCLP